MGRVYKNPPLVEALCEFRFESGQPWDWTIPGLVYDRVRGDFPKKKQQNVIEMEVQADQKISQSVKGGISRMQFLREDEQALIQVGPNLLVVNHLRPYPTWGSFRDMIRRGLTNYREVANPMELNRIGLRYINRIEIPEPSVEIEDYLLAVPNIPGPVPQIFTKWIQRVEIPYERLNGLMIMQSGITGQEDTNATAFLLDLDFITLDIKAIGLDDAMKWVEQAHSAIEDAFEACITDNTRDLMKEVKRG